MEAIVTNRPLEQVIAAINALDLESVKIRVTDPALGEGWTREYAQGIEQGYRNYLIMLAKYQDHAEDILLSRDVDEFWHTHILQTIKYTDDCEAIFGKYLHHAPHIGEVTSADVKKRTAQAEKTRRLYQSEYGSEQDTAWAGIFVRPETRPVSDTGVRMENAAMSGAAIRMKNAAMSGAAIRVQNAAMSGAAIRMENAAMSGVAIRGKNAAMSGAAIRMENAAMSGAAIRANDSAGAVAVAA